MNWLDRVYLSLAPEAGLRRVRARTAVNHLQQISDRISLAYDGAKGGRRSDGWYRPSTSANSEVGVALRQLRDGARDLERNNPLAAKACSEYEIKVVGTGITPQARTDNPELNKVLDDLFWQWSNNGNYDGQPGYFGIQGLGFRSIFRDGEALIRHRQVEPQNAPKVTFKRKKVAIPYQLQLLESDFLDNLKTSVEPGDEGYIIQGVQFDPQGRRTGYWLHPSHPGDMGLSGLLSNYSASEFVPVSDIEHGRRIQRAGQVRGVSSLAPVLVALHELDNYEQAEQTRKLIEACLTAFVIQPDDDGQSLGSVVQDSSGNAVESFEPGMIAYLRGGKQVQVSEPKAAGGYAEYMRTRHRVIAAGVGMPYEVLTNDYSQSNYSSSRMGLVSFKKITEHLQWSVAIPFFGDPVWRRFIDTCEIAGIVPANVGNKYQVQWAPPPFDLLDREAEALADLFELRIGKKTWAQLVGEQGEDPAKQADVISHWNKVWDDLGLIFDCDPRKSSRTGIAQKAHEDAKNAPGTVLQGFEPREAEQLAAVIPQQVIMSQQPAPNVNVSSPDIHMDAPNVTYHAPAVNVSSPPINLRIGSDRRAHV